MPSAPLNTSLKSHLPPPAGPEACNTTYPCVSGKQDFADFSIPSPCNTGIAAGGANADFYCAYDSNALRLPTARTGFGAYCYPSANACLQGPNGCSVAGTICEISSTCSTGTAGDTPGFSWYCPLTTPNASLPNGATCTHF